MIFERENGCKLTKDYLSKIATTATNEFLEELGLDEKVEVSPEDMLIKPAEARRYFKPPIMPVSRSQRDFSERIRRRIPFFCDEVIYTPLLKDRRTQGEYWDSLLEDLFLYVSGTMQLELIERTKKEGRFPSREEIDGAWGEFFSYRIDSRYNSRDSNSPGYAWYGYFLPNHTFTIPGVIHECIHLAALKKTVFYPTIDLVIEETIGGLSQLYSTCRSIPIVMKHFSTYRFPEKWVSRYRRSVAELKVGEEVLEKEEKEEHKKAFEMIDKIGAHVNGNLDDGIQFMGEALRAGVRTYQGMLIYLQQ